MAKNQTDRSNLFIWVTIGLTLFSAAGQLATEKLRISAGPIAPACALVLLVCEMGAAFSGQFANGRQLATSLGGVFFLGGAAEICGLRTGWPFGRYVYTDRWWPTVALPGVGAFPVQLPFAWVLIVGCCALAVPARLGTPLRSLAAGSLAALVDLFMEAALAGPADYWRWITRGPLPGHAPWSNSLAWFGLGAAGSYWIGVSSGASGTRRGPLSVLACQVVLMLVLAIR